MNEERIKELFSNEEYVKGLVDLGSYEAASAKLAEDGVEVSVEELKKLVELLKKKADGELTDEELEEVAGGLGGVLGFLACSALSLGVLAGLSGTIYGAYRATRC